MYCPQCGQQQVSGEMRFCSRCGFPLGGVLNLLANGGVLVGGDAAAAAMQRHLSPRRRGYRQGGLMMLISLIATPIMAVLSDMGLPELLIPLTAIIFFWGGIVRMLYARFFEETIPMSLAQGSNLAPPAYIPPTGPQQFVPGGTSSQGALPPQRSTPASGWRQPTNTAEVVRPPSVTENTTRLLDDKIDPPRQ